MNDKSFTTSFSVDKSPSEVFNSVNNVRGWWSEQIDGNTDKVNEVFLYHYKDVHICKIKIIEFVPEQKVVWHILENHFGFTKDKTEWKDTKVIFEISKKDGETQLRFTHLGLVPDYECYEICNEAWTNYVNNSLRNLITKGKGQPNPEDGEGFNAKIVEKWNLK